MPSIVDVWRHELLLATLLMQEFNRHIGPALPQVNWDGEDGLYFADAGDLIASVAHRIFDRTGGKTQVFQRIEFELVKVVNGIKTHYHENTDSAVIVLGVTPNPYAWEAVLEQPLPYPGGHELSRIPLESGILFVLPRRIWHGFDRRDASRESPLYLLSASCPGYDPKDTIYTTTR